MKIVVPISPSSIEEANQIDASKYDKADIIEWRADSLSHDAILTVAPAIFEKFSGHEILFTVRSQAQGGLLDLSPLDYISLLKDIDSLYHPDYIDFDYYTYQEVFEHLRTFSNLVLSYYNYDTTPENLMEIFSELTTLAPRVVRIAVMARTEQDVLDVMNYTRGFKTLNPNQSYATISMGKLGKISRMAANVIGSSWSIASLEKQGELGHISLPEMTQLLAILNEDSPSHSPDTIIE